MLIVRDRLISTLITSSTPNDVDVDFGALVERLLLFDTFVLHSRNLLEIPHLVERFSLEAVIRLFKSSAIELCVDKWGLGSKTSGQGAPTSPYDYEIVAFGLAQPDSLNKDIANLTQSLGSRNLSRVRSLRYALKSSIEYSAASREKLDDAPRQLAVNFGQAAVLSELVSPYVLAAATKEGFETTDLNLEIGIQNVGDKVYRCDSNLARSLQIDDVLAGKIIERGLLALGTEISRSQQMELYQALTHFAPADVPMFGSHLSFLARQMNPDLSVENFYRVIEIKDLPDIRAPEVIHDVNLHKVLDARSTDAGSAFREWIRTADGLSDVEISEQLEYHIEALEKVGLKLGSKSGKVLRWLATVAITGGVSSVEPIAGQLAGLGLGAINTFLVDKIIQGAGEAGTSPAAFIENGYKSIFEPTD